MGDKELDAGTNGLAESTYSVIAYPAKNLPNQYDHMLRAKWKRTLRHGNEYFQLWQADSFFSTYEKLINVYLSRPETTVRLALLDEDRDIALGFSVIEGSVLHYVYVQHEQRNKGIAKSLIPNKIRCITHLTTIGMKFWNNNFPDAVFDPSR